MAPYTSTMTPRWWWVLVAAGTLIGACAGGDGWERPQPSEPAIGHVVASVDVGSTRFLLYDEGDGCLAVDVSHPGMQRTVDRTCVFGGTHHLAFSSACGWLADPSQPRGPGCDLTLPVVVFGQVRDAGIGYVCFGSFDASGSSVVSARFVTFDEPGYVLDRVIPGETPHPHPFTVGGLRFGEPPLDAPSAAIYEMCEEQAPWGERETEIHMDLIILLGDDLQSHDVTVIVEAGTGPRGVNGASARHDGTIVLPVRVSGASTHLGIRVDREGDEILGVRLPWPDEMQTILDEGRECNGHVELRLVITGDPQVVFDFVRAECAA
jgi:hypothetical protein